MAPHVSLLDLIRRAIDQQTTFVGTVVTNLDGAQAGQLGPGTLTATQRWAHVVVPANDLLDLAQVYTLWQTAESPRFDILQPNELPGTVYFLDPSPACHLLATGVVVLGGTQQIPLTIETETTTGQWGVYVDGALVRRGAGTQTTMLSLPDGSHTLELVLYAAKALVQVPPTLPLSADAFIVPTPTLQSLTTTAADVVTGATKCLVTWSNDPRVGGIRVLRREVRGVGTVTTLSDLTPNGTVALTFAGDVTTLPESETPAFHVGEELYTRTDFIGVIAGITVDAGMTRVTVRMAPDQDTLPPALVGQYVWVGQWLEVGRLGRSASGGETTFEDASVLYGQRYDYCLQAWSVWNPNLWSTYSASLSIRAGDIDPPGCAQIMGVTSSGKMLTLHYHTPSDGDYAGANLYAVLTRYGVVTAATDSSVQIAVPTEDAPPDGFFTGWTADVDDQLVPVAVSTATGTLTLGAQIERVPLAGDVITLTRRSKVITDFGLPDTDDAVSVPMPTEETTFELRTFDKSRNEQTDDDMLLCGAAQYVFIPGEFNRPTVYIDELTPTEQANFEAPYNDPFKWTVVLLGAQDVFQSTDGVTINVQTKTGSISSFPASAPPAFELTQLLPPVQQRVAPYTLAGSRYYALERTTDINWIVVSATDGNGNESRDYYFATSAPFVRMPEVTEVPSETATDAVLDLWVFDPDNRCAHTPLGSASPTDWNGVQFAHAVGAGQFSPYTAADAPVETTDAGKSRRFRYTVPLTGAATVRIAYRVIAQLADGDVGQIAQGVVSYSVGAEPGLPVVSGTFDETDGSLVLQLAGDSNTHSLQYYVLPGVRLTGTGYEAQRTVGGPWLPLPTQSELATIFSTPNLTEEVNGRFTEVDAGVVIQPGDRCYVAARASDAALGTPAWPGRVSTDGAGGEAFATRIFTREGTYLAPTVLEQLSESVTAGVYTATLTVQVVDPQARLRAGSGVIFRRQPGTNTAQWDPAPMAQWYSPPETSASIIDDVYEYTATVTLYEGQLSRITYAVIGEDANGDNDAVLELRSVVCGIGTKPSIPQVQGVIDALGRWAVSLIGDSDTTGFRYKYAVGNTTTPPTPPTVPATLLEPLVNGRTHVTNTLEVLDGNSVVALTVLAFNRDGVASEPFTATWARGDIYIAPDVEEIVDETTDLIDGASAPYGVLQLRITDPQSLVTLVEFSAMSGNDPANWERTWVSGAWQTTWNPPVSTTPESSTVQRYLYQVPLAVDHVSRIQYRVRGLRADGSSGVLFQSSVMFDIGAKPTITELGGHIDALGRYWPTFRGDSDCRSWVLAVRVGQPSDAATAYPTLTDVQSPAYPQRRVYLPPVNENALREYPDPDGSPAPDFFRDVNGDPVIVQPGRMLFVTAMAYATNDGGAALDAYKSQLRTFAALRAAPYVPPEVRLDASETATTGTLKVYVKDPNSLMTGAGAGVYFRKMSGREAQWESGYSAYAPVATVAGEARYEATVALPDAGAKIGYQVRCQLADGVVGVFKADVVTFSPSAKPGAPIVQLLVNTDGSVRAVVSGDSDTTHLKVVFSTAGAPTVGDVNAASALPVTPGQTVVPWGGTLLANQTIYVAVKALNTAVTPTEESDLVRLDSAAGVSYVRPTVAELATETDKTGSLQLTISDPQNWLRSITLKKQTGTGAWTSRTVTVTPPYTPVTETVDLATRKTSRIQYELIGIREDGSQGLIDTAIVAFRPGATPSEPTLDAFVDANGQLTIDVIGDSDTQGARIAVVKTTTPLVKTDVLGGTNPVGIVRTVKGPGRVLRWVVPTVDFDLDPGDFASIGAIAYPDAACSDNTLSSEIGTLVVSRTSAYQQPTLTLTPSETETVGTLAVTLTDPQRHCTAIETQTKAGRNAWSAWSFPATWERGVSTVTTASISETVALQESVNSYIRVRMIGKRADGSTGVIAEDTMPFSAGIRPGVPDVRTDVQTDGSVHVTFNGDSDTQSFRYGVTTIAVNSTATAIATAVNNLTLSSTANGRVVRVNSVGTASGANAVLIAVQGASGANGAGQLSTLRGYAMAMPSGSGLTGVTRTIAKLIDIQPTSVQVQVTCTDGGQVQLTGVTNVTRTAGATAGTWATSGSTWTFSRHATLPGAADFAGGQVAAYGDSVDSVYIPSMAESVKPPLTVTIRRASATTTQVQYGFTVNDPTASGQPFQLTINAEGVAPPSGYGTYPVTLSNVSAATEQFLTFPIPATGSPPGHIRVRAWYVGNAFYPDEASVTVAPQAGGLIGVVNTVGSITDITATTVDVQCSADIGSIQLVSVSNATQITGYSTGVWYGSPITARFNRHATLAGVVRIKGGNLAGYADTLDEVYIPSQLEATKPPMRLRVSSMSTTGSVITYNLAAVNQNESAVAANYSQTNSGGVSGVSLSGSQLTATMGSTPGQITVTGTNAAYYPDTLIISVPDRSGATPVFREETTESTDTGTLTIRCTDPANAVSSLMYFRYRNATTDPPTWTVDWYAQSNVGTTTEKTWTALVQLNSKRAAVVEWRAYDAAGTTIIGSGSVRFGQSNRPVAPEISVTVNEDGTWNAELHGDTDTVDFLWAAQSGSSAQPTPSSSIAADGNKRARLISRTDGTGVIPLGGTVVVAAQGRNGQSAVGPVAYGMFTRTNKPVTGKSVTLNGSDFTFGSATGTKSGRYIYIATAGTISATLPMGNGAILINMGGKGGYITGGSYSLSLQVGASAVLSGFVTTVFPGYDQISSSNTFYTVSGTNNVSVNFLLPAGANIEYVYINYNAPSLDNTI